MGKRSIVIAVLALFASLPLTGQQPNGQKPRRTSKVSEAKKTQSDRLQILQQELPKLAGSALSFKNLELKVETMGRLADLVWSVDADGGRLLFQKTYELLRSIEPAVDRQQGKSDEESSKLPRGKLIALYVRFFSLVAKHDSTWKEQLLKDAPEFLSSPGVARNLDLSTADFLLQEKDPKAYDFIEAGTSNGVSGLANTLQILDLFRRFRELDATKADQLFSQLIRQIERQGDISADDLLTIGNYLFTGRPPNPEPEERILITPVYVGSVAFHADISYDRPGRSPELVDAYLRSSVAILTRPAPSEAILLTNRAAAFLLLPKARRFAPDLVPILSNLSSVIDPKRTNSVEARSSAPEPVGPQSLESVMETLDTIKDPTRKDEYCLRAIWSFYIAADFESASALTNRMGSAEIREQLSSLISIGRAINSLQKGDLDSARLQTRRLHPGKERSFLWFAIAARMLDKGDVQNGKIAIDNGLVDARRTDGSVKASLLLLGTELTSGIDFAAGSNLLSEALTVINTFDSDLNEPLRFEKFVRVKVGSQSATFSTDVSGFKSGTVRGAFKVPLSRDPNGAISLILQLKNEYVRSSALLAFVSELTS